MTVIMCLPCAGDISSGRGMLYSTVMVSKDALESNRKRRTEEEIVEILRSAEKGDMSIGEVRRSYGVSEVTFYKWRKRYGGLEKSDVRKIKDLEKKTPS